MNILIIDNSTFYPRYIKDLHLEDLNANDLKEFRVLDRIRNKWFFYQLRRKINKSVHKFIKKNRKVKYLDADEFSKFTSDTISDIFKALSDRVDMIARKQDCVYYDQNRIKDILSIVSNEEVRNLRATLFQIEDKTMIKSVKRYINRYLYDLYKYLLMVRIYALPKYCRLYWILSDQCKGCESCKYLAKNSPYCRTDINTLPADRLLLCKDCECILVAVSGDFEEESNRLDFFKHIRYLKDLKEGIKHVHSVS